MKTKFGLRSPKKVYYFSHQQGILQKRGKLLVLRGFATGLMVATVLCGVGYGAKSYYQAEQSAKSYQQAVAEPSVDQAQIEKDKLSTAPTQAQEDKALASVISQKLSTLPKGQQWSVYVRDLQTNRMANIDTDETYESASLYKLFLLPALENKASVTSWNSWKNRVNKKTITSCVDLMIRLSDNPCGEAIGRYVGWDYADQVNKSLGFSKTKLGGTTPQTTAREVGDLMYRLQTSQLLSDKARRVVFDGLYAQVHADGIPAGCGPECLIANKTGESTNVHHDAAVVTSGAGKYIVVIMSKGASWPAVAEVERTINNAILP